jgi:hypothetical protein
MEFTGQIKHIGNDYITNNLEITFTVNEKQLLLNEYQKLKDIDKLKIKVDKFRNKRSLDANAYAWKLMSEIAEVLNTSKDEVYEKMLQRYGTNETDSDGNVVVFSIQSKIDISKMEIHCAYIGSGNVNGKEFNHYRLIKGTSEYDTKEMSKFIDGVVSECQELGIETLTPDELAKMKAMWGV